MYNYHQFDNFDPTKDQLPYWPISEATNIAWRARSILRGRTKKEIKDIAQDASSIIDAYFESEKEAAIDLIKSDGSQKNYKKVEMIAGTDYYYSHKTKAKYPLSWTIKIPAENLELKVTALISDQEIIYGPINYWEGPVSVTGGVGFMELVGYPANYNPFLLAGSDFIKRIKRSIMN